MFLVLTWTFSLIGDLLLKLFIFLRFLRKAARNYSVGNCFLSSRSRPKVLDLSSWHTPLITVTSAWWDHRTDTPLMSLLRCLFESRLVFMPDLGRSISVLFTSQNPDQNHSSCQQIWNKMLKFCFRTCLHTKLRFDLNHGKFPLWSHCLLQSQIHLRTHKLTDICYCSSLSLTPWKIPALTTPRLWFMKWAGLSKRKLRLWVAEVEKKVILPLTLYF